MNVIECLEKYKSEIIAIGRTKEQKNFLADSFSRWYINVDKLNDNLFPAQNVVIAGIEDIKYSNKEKNMKFNVLELIKTSEMLYKKYLHTCTQDMEDIYLRKPLNLQFNELITDAQEARLRRLYLKTNKTMDEYEYYRNKLIALYKLIGMNNMHLSIPPIFEGVELFGSPLNTHNDYYCSPFDLEKKFGSSGSFWKYNFNKNGIYLCNPPFDEKIINNMCIKLKNELETTAFNVVVVITIPVWDSGTQKKLNIKNYNLDFEGYDCLIGSGFLKESDVLDKFKFPYYNYYSNKMSPASYTHLLFLSNMPPAEYRKIISINKFKSEWLNFVKTHI